MTKWHDTIAEFLQNVKASIDEFSLLGALFDEDDLTDKNLKALRDDYKELVWAVQVRDTSITFEELHEKLLNYEASLNIPKPEQCFSSLHMFQLAQIQPPIGG